MLCSSRKLFISLVWGVHLLKRGIDRIEMDHISHIGREVVCQYLPSIGRPYCASYFHMPWPCPSAKHSTIEGLLTKATVAPHHFFELPLSKSQNNWYHHVNYATAPFSFLFSLELGLPNKLALKLKNIHTSKLKCT